MERKFNVWAQAMNLEEKLLQSNVGPQWSHIGIRHHHGIDLPLSALHTKDSCGIGEFLDLLPLIDWCPLAQLDFLQLLPLNHYPSDPSPYNSESSCAFNPLYLSLWALPGLKDKPALQKQLFSMQQLTTSCRVLYEQVAKEKLSFRRVFLLFVF